MTVTVRPARPASDLAAFPFVGLSRQHGRAFAMQLGADAFVVERDGTPVMMAGRWMAEDHQEIWMMHAPAMRDPFVLARALAVGRRDYLAPWAKEGPAMVSLVKQDNAAGHRLARLYGFVADGPHPDAPEYMLYRFKA